MSAPIQLKEIESKTWAANSSLIFQIANLPKHRRVRGWLFELDGTLTNADAEGARFTPAGALAGLLGNLVEQENPFFKMRASGKIIFALGHHMTGRTLNNGVYSVTNGVPVTQKSFFYLPLCDPRSHSPYDTAQPTEAVIGTVFEIKTPATGGVFSSESGTTDDDSDYTSMTWAGTMRITAVLTEGAGAFIPTYTRIDFEDWAQQTVQLAARGSLTHLGILNEATDKVSTTGDYTRCVVEVEGEKLVDNIRTEQLIAMFNNDCVSGGDVVAQPAGAAAANAIINIASTEQEDALNTYFLPIYQPPPDYKVTQLPYSENSNVLGYRVDLTGATLTARFYYRMYIDHNEQVAQDAKRIFGKSPVAPMQVKTASKQPVRATSTNPARTKQLVKALPKRIQ